MNKENLLLIAEGHKLIALAYAREAGADLEILTNQAHSTLEQAQVTETAPQSEEKAPTAKKGKVTPKLTPKEEEPEVDEESTDEELEGYSLDELNGMTVKKLKEIASEIGVHIPKDTKKADIIDLIMEGAVESDEDTVEEEEEAPEVNEDVQEDEDDEDVQEDDEEYEELTIAHVEAMDDSELKELAKDYEVDLPKKFNREKAIEALVKALFEPEEIEAHYNQDEEAENEADTDEDEGEELTPEDLDEMSLSELKELANEYEVKFPKLIKAEKLRELLVEELFEVEDDEDDSTDLDQSDLAEEYGLNDMSVEDLSDLLVEHEIKAKGNKQALIAKVLEAIEEGVIEVGEEGE